MILMMDYMFAILQVPLVQISLVSLLIGILLGGVCLQQYPSTTEARGGSEPDLKDEDEDEDEDDEDYVPSTDDDDDADGTADSDVVPVWDRFPCTSRCISSMTVKQLKAVTTRQSRDKSHMYGYRNKEQLIYALILDLISDYSRASRLPAAVKVCLIASILDDLNTKL